MATSFSIPFDQVTLKNDTSTKKEFVSPAYFELMAVKVQSAYFAVTHDTNGTHGPWAFPHGTSGPLEKTMQ